MALQTKKELRDHVASTVRDTQISTLIDNFINITLEELYHFHPWPWLRRKTTFSTVADQEDYVLDEEVGQIRILRQRSTPQKLAYVPDELFYKMVPDPEDQATGTPRLYRLWEQTGFSTNLAAADTIYAKSSSTSDGSSFKVVVEGRDSNGLVIKETLTLDGTTAVTSTTTFAASGLLMASKSAQTTGTITLYRTTGDTVLTRIGPDETAPRLKKISLYPVPSSVITMYLEYSERLRRLVNDTDVPQMDSEWNWVLLEGTLAKTWSYKQNDQQSGLSQARYDRGLRLMRMSADRNLDYVPVLQGRSQRHSPIRRYRDSVGDDEPVYGVGF